MLYYTNMKESRHTYQTNGNTTTVFHTRQDGKILEFTIDTDDLEKVILYRWYIKSTNKGRKGYFFTNIDGKSIYLHHFIIGKKKGKEIDHIDRNTFNNTRKNLRIVNRSINRMNRIVTNKYGFPGLEYKKGQNAKHPWRVRLRIKDPTSKLMNHGYGTRLLHIGSYKTKKLAIEGRRKAEQKYYGAIFH